MLPTARLQSTGREKLNLVERVQQAIDRVPFPQRIVPILGAVLFLCPVLAPVAVVTKSRTKMATAYVAMLAIWLIYIFGLYSSGSGIASLGAGALVAARAAGDHGGHRAPARR